MGGRRAFFLDFYCGKNGSVFGQEELRGRGNGQRDGEMKREY